MGIGAHLIRRPSFFENRKDFTGIGVILKRQVADFQLVGLARIVVCPRPK